MADWIIKLALTNKADQPREQGNRTICRQTNS